MVDTLIARGSGYGGAQRSGERAQGFAEGVGLKTRHYTPGGFRGGFGVQWNLGRAETDSKVMLMEAALRTLLTKAGRKQARQVPPLCRTLG
jgi:hypothetical protein